MSDPVPGLDCRAIERLQPSLTAEVAEVQWRIARCLYDLTVPHSGKRTACDCGLVKDLVPLLTHDHHLVKTHSASVLMRYMHTCICVYLFNCTVLQSLLRASMHYSMKKVWINWCHY